MLCRQPDAGFVDKDCLRGARPARTPGRPLGMLRMLGQPLRKSPHTGGGNTCITCPGQSADFSLMLPYRMATESILSPHPHAPPGPDGGSVGGPQQVAQQVGGTAVMIRTVGAPKIGRRGRTAPAYGVRDPNVTRQARRRCHSSDPCFTPHHGSPCAGVNHGPDHAASWSCAFTSAVARRTSEADRVGRACVRENMSHSSAHRKNAQRRRHAGSQNVDGRGSPGARCPQT